MEITYLSEPVQDYAKAIDAATTVSELRAAIEPFGPIAHDALTVARAMLPADWPEFRRGLKSERRGRFAGVPWADKYMAITMPEVMFQVSRIASHFGAPWGAAYFRCKDAKMLEELGDGTVIWIAK